MQTTELEVDGMTCGSCVASVTKALQRVPGVQAVDVDLASGIARVRGDDARDLAPALVAALGAAGYEAKAAADPKATRPQASTSAGASVAPAAKRRGGCCCG